MGGAVEKNNIKIYYIKICNKILKIELDKGSMKMREENTKKNL